MPTDGQTSGGVPSAAGKRHRGKPVMMDVARLAGVSHQTVSRVLNDHPSVRRETRDRVLQAMRQLDYQRNTAARTLVTRRSRTLGLVSFDTTLIGPSSIVYAIERAACDAGYFVSIASARSLREQSVSEAVNRLREQAVEGILAIAPMETALAALARVPQDIPLVGVGVAEAAGVPMVGVDNMSGAILATRHLLDLGHRTVHHISGPPGWPEADERVVGWRRALAERGADAHPVRVGDWSSRSGYDAARPLTGDPAVTAVFCANDQMALGALRAFSEAGRNAPADISIVGYDDIPEAAFFLPPLTTVQQDFAELGRCSIELLLEQIDSGQRTHRHLRFPPGLVIRDSTAAPPGSAGPTAGRSAVDSAAGRAAVDGAAGPAVIDLAHLKKGL